ncbi:MAG: hypothetical protein WC224_05665 [Sphaerochaetaceae bacterium]
MFGDTLITIVAIVTPFLFVAWIVNSAMKAKERRREREREARYGVGEKELERELRDLIRRIENLEIIAHSRRNNKE